MLATEPARISGLCYVRSTKSGLSGVCRSPSVKARIVYNSFDLFKTFNQNFYAKYGTNIFATSPQKWVRCTRTTLACPAQGVVEARPPPGVCRARLTKSRYPGFVGIRALSLTHIQVIAFLKTNEAHLELFHIQMNSCMSEQRLFLAKNQN